MAKKNDIISEMVQALEYNIAYLAEEGSLQIKVKNASFVSQTSEGFIYEFELDFFQELEINTEITAKIAPNRNINGKIIAINNKIIHIIFEDAIKTSNEVKIIISSYYLLEILKEKLKSIVSQNISSTDFPEKLFKIKAFKTNLDNNYIFLPDTNLNDSQQTAIRTCLGSEITYVWGPPGTGKTITIANIIRALLSYNLSALLISHTNIATDGALIKVIENLGINNEDYKNGKIIRVGQIHDTELKKYELVDINKIIDSKTNNLKKRINEINIKLREIEELLNKYKVIQNQVIELKKVSDDLIIKKNELNSLSNDKIKYSQEIASLNTKINVTQQNIVKCNNSNFLMNFLNGLDIKKLVAEENTCKLSIINLSNKVETIIKTITEIENNIKKLDLRINELKFYVGPNDPKIIALKIENLESEIKKLHTEENEHTQVLEKVSLSIIKDAKIVASTLTKSYSSKSITERQYDCVIIDEASMAPLPALWCAASLANKKVIIVGDCYQLPPVFKHKIINKNKKSKVEIENEELLIEKWFKNDIYTYTKIYNDLDNGKSLPYVKQLKIQFRMNPNIADVINEFIYKKNKLEPGDKIKNYGFERLNLEPLAGSNFGIYDMSQCPTLTLQNESNSYYNIYQAILCVELVKKSINNGYKEIGVISPFRAQVNLLKKMLLDENIENASVTADTVHRYQGSEKQIIIFDITTSKPTKLTDDEKEGGDDEKLINVAISRAKEKFIMVCDVNQIKKKHSQSSLIKKIIEYNSRKGFPQIDSQNILNHFQVHEKNDLWLENIFSCNSNDPDSDPNKSLIANQIDFYKSFKQDIINAKQEIIIDSPFITSSRVNDLMPLFKNSLNKGIKIFILTRHPSEHESFMKEMAINEIKLMEDIGIVVLPFRGMNHRKLSIIDRKILWYGSLNILSQKESNEIMIKHIGENGAKQILSFLNLDKNIGNIGENLITRCEQCKEPGSWYWTEKGIYGLWTYCLTSKHRKGKPAKTEEEIKEKKEQLKTYRKMTKDKSDNGIPICPVHKIELIQRKNKRSGKFFWGCPKYPVCKITENIK